MLYPVHYYDNAEMTGEPIMHSFIKIQSGWPLFGCDNNRGSGLTSKPYKFKQLYDAYVDGGSKGKVVVPCCVLDLDEVDIEAEGTYYDEILGDETRFAYSEIDVYTLEGEAEPTDPTTPSTSNPTEPQTTEPPKTTDPSTETDPTTETNPVETDPVETDPKETEPEATNKPTEAPSDNKDAKKRPRTTLA